METATGGIKSSDIWLPLELDLEPRIAMLFGQNKLTLKQAKCNMLVLQGGRGDGGRYHIAPEKKHIALCKFSSLLVNQHLPFASTVFL